VGTDHSSDHHHHVEPSLANTRTAVAEALSSYARQQYNTDRVVSGAYAPSSSSGGGGQVVHLVIYGEKLNLRNFWSGSWLSVWKVDITSGEPLMEGTIKVGRYVLQMGR